MKEDMWGLKVGGGSKSVSFDFFKTGTEAILGISMIGAVSGIIGGFFK